MSSNTTSTTSQLTATPAKHPNPPPSSSHQAPPEESLRTELHKAHKVLVKREPLNPSYHFLLLQNSHAKPPHITQDPLYKPLGANLRARVERYMGRHGAEGIGEGDGRARTVGRHRQRLDESEAVVKAFTLRECKEFEQKGFIAAAIVAEDSQIYRELGRVEREGVRKRKLHAMALGLQERERKKKYKEQNRALILAAKQKLLAAEQAKSNPSGSEATEAKALKEQLRRKETQHRHETERIAAAAERERQREKERLRLEQLEREAYQREREEELRRERSKETPQEALQRLYQPIFQALWEMEFSNLHPPGINPFRIVIDAETCVAMGLSDYCDIIQKPMNLTFIREKVLKKKYVTLQEFFEDVELMISNALLYNSDPKNEYHIAANVMKKKYIKLRKQVVQKLHGQG